MIVRLGTWKEHTGLKYAYCHDQIQFVCEFLVGEATLFHYSHVCVSDLNFKKHVLMPGNAAPH